MKNTIFLKRKSKLVIDAGNSRLEPEYVFALIKNIEPLGYSISGALAERLSTLDENQLSVVYKQLISHLKTMVGANVKFRPIYPNFPKQVEELPKETLFDINTLHYLGDWIGARIMPDFAKKRRPKLSEETPIKIVDLGTNEEFEKIFTDLLSAKASLSEDDKADLSWFVENYFSDLKRFLPNQILHKENLAYISGLLLKYTEDATEIVSNYIKTATDILRLATALSDGDVSLSSNTKFKSFKRSERRFLLELLEQCNAPTEDMLRHKKRWIRLGERLHPSEYKHRYPKSSEAFDIIRNSKPYQTFNRTLEKHLKNGEFSQAADHLEKRPGEFARRLDHFLRSSDDSSAILEKFGAISEQVSTNVLLQILAHFKDRDIQSELRVFFPKGEFAKAFAIPNEVEPLNSETCTKVVELIKNTLSTRFGAREPLGNVYIDPALKNYTIPLAQRAASKSLKCLARGSRLDIPKGDTIRFFLWWKEGIVDGVETGRVDVDLSAVIYDENWEYQEHISYTNLKSGKFRSYHSGDITSAPNGACEFIDIDIPSVLKHNARYIVMSLNSYTSQSYCNLPECYGGWMMRKHPNSGEVFEPKTVMNKIDIAADSKIAIPVILDLKERKFIWTDLALTRNPYLYNNVEGNQKGMVLIGQAMADLKKPNLFDLFELHSIARGNIVKDREKAEIVFSAEEGITPYDTEKILSDFL